MASYATSTQGAIGTLKPHISLAVHAGNPGGCCSSTLKPHILLAARAVPKPYILLAAGAVPKPNIFLVACARNPGSIGSSTPKPHIFRARRAGNLGAIGGSTRGCSGSAISSDFNPYRFKFHEKDISSEENLWNLYERWRVHHNVSRSSEEIHKHFNIFKREAVLVHYTNKMDLSYTVGLNKFSDMTDDEFSRYRGRGTRS